METRAPFVIVGAFVLAAIVAVFGFVYWLQNTGGLEPRSSYRVQFEGSVPGLSTTCSESPGLRAHHRIPGWPGCGAGPSLGCCRDARSRRS